METQSKMSILRGTRVKDGLIRKWIRYACEMNDVPELSQVVQIEWNPRFTRRTGDAMYCPHSYRATIRLSLPLWRRASEEQRRETVLHETCHVIAEYKFGILPPHGSEWKQAMINCGLEPVRTHAIDRTGLVRRQRLFTLCDCPAEKRCRIGVRLYNAVQRGGEFWCKVCGLHLDRKAIIEEERRSVAEVQKSEGFQDAHEAVRSPIPTRCRHESRRCSVGRRRRPAGFVTAQG